MSTEDLLITNRPAVREAFGKTEKEVLEDVQIVREWMKTQKHLPEVPYDDIIEHFLVTTKFSIEMTKKKLDMYYTIRSLVPEIYNYVNPNSPQMKDITKTGIFVALPKLTKELHRVFIMKTIGSPDDFDTYKFFAHSLSIFELRMQYDISVGDVFIIDYEQLKMGHVLKMTPVHIKKAVTISEKVFSSRIKGIHIVNYPSYVDTLMNISKTILKPKLLARIHLHSDINGLQQHIDKEILPKDYNGSERSIEELNELWLKKLKEHGDRFDELDRMKVNEELRPTPLKNDEVLGYHGNFKKLDVD